eukprot:GHVL01010034.1.p1 GENE.GHVL01010034.1~~GHVL01010034.1.p1  ORF type:complete len:2742 (+),score=421.27 GHVL01010034.1:35-8227(+)
MDYVSMGNIFKGLAASGSWGCFDEFNRLVPEVLSVCSVQFKSVVDAIKAKSSRFLLQGTEINLDPTCGAYITMNPGYLGRSELPEGLKALFRPITVMVPDMELICENILMAEGFVGAKLLARKFTRLYSLCKDLLSKAQHYDWGLRAIKSVLVVAGGFKRAEPDLPEQNLLMRALRDSNVAKIVGDDLGIFKGLLSDLFPGVDVPRKRDVEFEAVVEKTCKEMHLDADDEFVLKVIQLKELMEIRHCVFLLGPPGCGKSSVFKTLAKSQDSAGQKTSWVDLNPKAVTTNELYGYVQMSTREWKDGLLSKTIRDLGQITNSNPKWIILDGDLDANWIESMNSVMDDNKLLTLASNERIPLKPHMKMLFEIRDLNFATPATVSRAGIVYISDERGNQWRSYVKSWLLRMKDAWSSETILLLERLFFEKYAPKTLQFIARQCKLMVPIVDISMMSSLCDMLESLLADQPEPSALEYWFCFCIVWACGGCITETDNTNYRKKFSDWFRNEFKTIKFPSKGLVYDYWVDGSKFEEWSNRVEELDYDSSIPVTDVTVSTSETVAMNFFMNALVKVQTPVMLIGLAGCGKTQLVKGLLGSLDNSTYMNHVMNFNYYTDASLLQLMLELPLEKKAGKVYAPPGKMRLVYFVDDLNMPLLDPYNTQTAIALLRQHADYQHWFDRQKNWSQKEIQSTQFIACMNPTAGSFVVNPRYQRHFWTLAVPFPDQTALTTIFHTFMKGHYEKKGFRQAIQEQVSVVIKAALSLHSAVASTFRKTAINFHYEFNLRHITNVFAGLLEAKPPNFQDAEKLVVLWMHESERTYGDRLVSLADLNKYRCVVGEMATKMFPKISLKKYTTNSELVVFSHFAKGFGEQTYDRVESIDQLSNLLQDALKEYNDANAAMDLVLFDDALKHVCRIARIASGTGGHALLVGVGGSGKQSLSRLAAHVCGYSTSQITISSTYGITELKADLQIMYQKAGVKDEGVMFLFTDSQITNEKFLVFLNDLLSSGDIADLYAPDEKDAIVNSVRSATKSSGLTDSKENCWDFFIGRIRKNLHMSICFSPVGESFRNRARKFPALVNCTAIDWFHPWPKDALHSVAKKFLENATLDDQVRDNVVAFMPFSFEEVNRTAQEYYDVDKRYAYNTPKSFLELIKLYKSMLDSNIERIQNRKEKLSNGLYKLQETQEKVSGLEEDLKSKSVVVEQMKKDADDFAETVGKEKAVVLEATEEATAKAEACETIRREATAIATDAKTRLGAAEPLVEQAQAALDSLLKKDFQEAKSLTKPPPGVDDVTAAVICLLARVDPQNIVDCDKSGKPKDTSWKCAKSLMSNVDRFLESLLGFKQQIDDGNVPPLNFSIMRHYLQLEHFNKESIEKKSRAAAGLADWVINIVKYYDVFIQVEPLRLSERQATERLETANAELTQVQKQAKELQEKLSKLVEQFNKAIEEKNAVVAEADRCEKKLNLAQRLVSALGSENDRWLASIASMEQQLRVMAGDVLVSAAFVSYVGVFTKKYRDELIWNSFLKFLKDKGVPLSADFNPLSILADDAQVALWSTQALPSDQVSIENGAIMENSERYPLIIDPQLQGILWIKNKELVNHLEVTRMSNPKLMRLMETALTNGYSVLIEDLDESLDAVLSPVIGRMVIKRGRSRYVKLGDKEIALSPNFKLFLHTKLSNPHYPPEIQAECAIINFTVTEQGLEDQLLALVVKMERPDLARRKVQLIKQMNGFKIKLAELENNLIEKLTSSKGDILEDVELIENLETTKIVSIEITEKVAKGKETEASINQTSENYRPTANRGALLFFLLCDLIKIHTFYMYSLDAFVIVVTRSMASVKIPIQKKQTSVDEFEEVKEVAEETVTNNSSEEPVTQQSFEQMTVTEEALTDEVEKTEEERDEMGAKEEYLEETKGVLDDENKTKPHSQKSQSQEDHDVKEEADDGIVELSASEFKARVELLSCTITSFVFNYCRRGLFDRHKLIAAAMLCIRILIREKVILESDVKILIENKPDPNPPPMPENCAKWMTPMMWAQCKSLEASSTFKNATGSLLQNLEQDSMGWRRWYGDEKADNLPKAYRDVAPIHKLMLLRALRPDRLSANLKEFVTDNLGESFVEQPPFSMLETYNETDQNTPMFFVLFPGTDPTPAVEQQAEAIGCTAANGKFVNISMGQGQEQFALEALNKAAKEGGWVMLQNVHLMQTWLKDLERILDSVSEFATSEFRCIVSSEPPPFPYQKIIPESILQKCVKIADEAPQDLRANLRRAFAKFDQPRLESCPSKPKEFKAMLFALCFFHSIVLGRKKFGSQGWSRVYQFNDGDLKICADVLNNYLSRYDAVPWEDIRYLFGEIMYGGHITDQWDRRTNNTYLQVLMEPGLLSGMNLAPNFKSPDASKLDYNAYVKYIEEKLPADNPTLFGLHPNAEIGYLSTQGDLIFKSIQDVQGGGGGDGGTASRKEDLVADAIASFLERLPSDLDMIDIKERATAPGGPGLTPFVIVSMQEAERTNMLLAEIRRSLTELDLGLQGALNISEAIEALSNAIYLNRVPATWEKLAYFSMKSLQPWFIDLLERVKQTVEWTTQLSLLPSLWISGLFNPMSFLTATMQVTARQNNWPLDDMDLRCVVTSHRSMDDFQRQQPAEGVYIHGLFLEGAGWEDGKGEDEGNLVESKLKVLHPALPIVNVIAVRAKDMSWDNMYMCPVYVTSMRGPTYVYTANLRMDMDDTESRWVLAGVAVLMSDD